MTPESPYRIAPLPGGGGLPLVIDAQQQRDPAPLCDWLRKEADWVQERLVEHGALLLRGFDVADAPAFERVARAIDDELKNEYLGTSPRDGLTDHVFTASELPSFYPIPQHCEMSFLAHPPQRVFFCCLREPAEGGGETPLADFRKVHRDLDPEVLKRFEEGGLRIIRNYSGPSSAGRRELFRLKRWDEMFLTTDRAAVETKCREQGFDFEWFAEDRLRLVNTAPIVRHHPVTGEPVWHNHSTTFHLSTAPGEYARIRRLRPTLRHWGLLQLSRLLVRVQRLTRKADEQSMHCTYLDGREIPHADMEHVRDVVWRHMVIEPWRRGDVVAIDNHSVAHGRLPYRGPREIAVAWA